MLEKTEHKDGVAGFRIDDDLAGSLPQATAEGGARREALAVLARRTWQDTGVVDYRSRGRLLIVAGDTQGTGGQDVIALAAELAGATIPCTVLIDGLEADSRDQVCRKLSTGNITVVAGRLAGLDGCLGRFTARLEGRRADADLAQLGPHAGEFFDLVLDLDVPPFLRHEVLPPGYYAPRGDGEALRAALAAIPRMTGDFSKPVYVNYQANICAHESQGITGCTRCLDACPADAVLDKGDRIAVNTSLCRGCGTCVMYCPTGALSYTFPPVQQWLVMIRDVLGSYRDAGGTAPELLVYDDRGAGSLRAAAAALPEHVIPVPVNEIGSLGADAWLSMLAYGAGAVMLLVGTGTPQSVLAGLQSELAVVRALLEGMGYAGDRLRRVAVDGDGTPATGTAGADSEAIPPAAFDPFEKRKTVRMALDHLYEHAPARRESTRLPEGAAFGEIQVDHDTCTLCMSCVNACPVQALQHDAAQLRLEFVESACVQCGLCRNTCPEDSIALLPRYVYDGAAPGRPRVLNEDEPFHCISCGKAFTGKRMLGRVADMLARSGKWSLDKKAPPEWLRMCGDCRIK